MVNPFEINKIIKTLIENKLKEGQRYGITISFFSQNPIHIHFKNCFFELIINDYIMNIYDSSGFKISRFDIEYIKKITLCTVDYRGKIIKELYSRY
jgi:hypothetical protein